MTCIQVNDSNFESDVLNSDQPVLVDFWAEWCQPCKMLGPAMEALATDFAGKAKICKMDVDSNRETSIKFGIAAIPTVILFKGGQVVKKFVGLQLKTVYADAIETAMEEKPQP